MKNTFGALALVALAACGGSEPAATTTTPTSTVSFVVVSPSSASLEIGGTQSLAAEARNVNGTVVSGKTATWSSSNTGSVTVDASGTTKAVTVGTAIISATIDGKSGVATVTVSAPGVSSVTLSAASSSLIAGATLAVQAAIKDKNGAALSGKSVAWSSSNTRVATVDAGGVVSGKSPGTTTITAVSENVTGTLPLTVTAPAGSVAPTIIAVSPASLGIGTTVTITGANFSTTPANNLVFIAGQPAVVTAATATQITTTVPSTIGCQSTQQVNVEVVTVAGAASAKQTLVVATQRTLAVGASYLLTGGTNPGCNELTAQGTYLLTVVNASKASTATASFELKGAAGGTGVVPDPRPAALVAVPRATIAQPTGIRALIEASQRDGIRAHLEHLKFERQIRRELGPSRNYARVRTSPSLIAGGSGSALNLPAVVPLTVGGTATVRFNYSTCTTGASPLITARVVYVGTKVVVLEDNTSALAGKIDADLITLAKDWENVSYPILQNFGDILAYDKQLDNNGRIIMMFTPRVNNAGGNLLGFVQSCDFYPPTAAASVNGSNQAEIFYARAVTDTTPGSTSLNGRPQWKAQMPGTLIHESKHLLANAERQATPILTDDEEVWLEEATAQLATELYGRAIHGNTWRGNALYTGVLDCEYRLNTAGCNGGVIAMGNHFGFLSEYEQGLENKSIIDEQYEDVYGGAWFFTRWLVDAFGGSSESTILQKLIRNFLNFGVDNVTDVSGRPWAELLSEFALMLAGDDVANVPAIFQVPSWNMPAIFVGYNKDFPNSDPAAPLSFRQSTFGTSFTTGGVNLLGGGAMLMRLNVGTTATTQLLDLHDVLGGVLPANTPLAISVVRIK